MITLFLLQQLSKIPARQYGHNGESLLVLKLQTITKLYYNIKNKQTSRSVRQTGNADQ
jgi:hypothetical protein